jgi:hypothetical protein
MTFPSLKILKKYGCEGFEEGNNFIHRNLFIFGMDFEVKNLRRS